MLEPLSQAAWSQRTANHLLARARFAGTKGEAEALYRRGLEIGHGALVEEMVDASVDWTDFPLPEWAQQGNGDSLEKHSFSIRLDDFTGWLVGQMADLPGVHAKMLKFFIDHFPVDFRKFPASRELIYLFRHFDILRKGALGNFRDLLVSVSWSEAMITMLDLSSSQRDNINENFAREYMELFTLGVDAGYSEADVLACARAFTGRRLRETFPYESYLDERTYFGGSRHGQYQFIDPTEKQLLVEEDPDVPGSLRPGMLEAISKPDDQSPDAAKEHGSRATDIVLAQPQCANFLAWKVWRYFASPNPTPDLVTSLGERFRHVHNYDLSGLLKDIFKCKEFYSEGVIGDQIKDPMDVLITTCNVLDVPPPPSKTSRLCLREMGFEASHPDSIEGWPEPSREGNQWMSTAFAMFRVNLPKIFTHGNIHALTNYRYPDHASFRPEPIDYDSLIPSALKATKNIQLLVDYLAARLFPQHEVSFEQKRIILNYMRRRRPGSPEKEMIRELVALMLALPEFQMQ